MEELYKPIKDFENYQVSNLGNVKNSRGHLISQATNDRGYKHSDSTKDKIRNSRLGTHRVYNEDGTWTMK